MIGVIGGNGVAATNRLCELIEARIVKAGGFRDCHHPEMIIWQATQAPSRSMFLEDRGESFIPDYIRIGQRLKASGCSELCMCCNTAHYYIETLQQEIGLPIINLIKEVGLRIRSLGVKKVGLMCSDGLVNVKFYDSVFAQVCPDVEIIYPSEEYQKLVTKGICNAKNAERYADPTDSNNPVNCFLTVVSHLLERKADCIIAGCTDINNVFREPSEALNGVPYVDSLEVLADCIAAKNDYLPK